MFCHNCGAQRDPTSQFCGACGVATQAAQVSAPVIPVAPPPQQPTGQPILSGVPGQPPQPGGAGKILGRKPRGRVVILAVVLAAVLVIAGLAAAVPAIIRNANPKLYLASCADKTFITLADASGKAADSLGIRGILESFLSSKVQQDFSIQLDRLPESSGGYYDEQLLGSGFAVTSQSDLKNRKMALEYALHIGTADLSRFRMFVDDAILALGSPDLVGNAFYGVNTETLGADFDKNEVLSGVISPDVSFNLFDLIDEAQKNELLSAETRKEITQLNQELEKEVEVAKDGKQRVEINGATENLPQFTVTIPESAARTWVRGIYRAIMQDETVKQALELMSAGDPDTKDQLMSDMSSSLDELLDMLQGNITLTLAIRDGYIASAVFFSVIEEADTTLSLQFGTDKSPIDDFAATLIVESGSDQIQIAWTTSGNHSGREGAYTDDSRLSASFNGETEFSWDFSTSLDTTRKSDNFEFSTTIVPDSYSEPVSIRASGTVAVDKGEKSLRAELDQVSMTAEDETLAISGSYSIAPCKQFDFEPDDIKRVADMSESQLYDLGDEILQNAQQIIANRGQQYG